MDQPIASQLGPDLSPLGAPSVHDFRDRNDRLSTRLSDSVNVSSVYQMYSIGFHVPQHHGRRPESGPARRRNCSGEWKGLSSLCPMTLLFASN
jgi:hypothetical protein